MDTHHKYKIKSRLFYPDIKFSNIFALGHAQAHYVRNVMRAQLHDFFGIFNGIDGEYACKIIEINKKNILLQPIEQIRPHLDTDNITLIFSVIKKTPMSYLIQKATELGVGTLQPVLTERTIIRDINLTRCQAIVIEAAEQCGLTTIPNILPLKKMEDILANYQNIIFCDEKAHATSLKEYYQNNNTPIDALLIGPEGGFTPSETNYLRQKDKISSITLGKRIMRAETAAIAALATIQALR